MSALLLAPLLAGSLFIAIGILGLLERLPPNGLAGIRTRYTRASRENWYRTHRAAAPLLIFGGVAVTMAALAFLPFAVAGKLSDRVVAVVVAVFAGVLLAVAVAAWLFGTHQARASGPRADSP